MFFSRTRSSRLLTVFTDDRTTRELKRGNVRILHVLLVFMDFLCNVVNEIFPL